LHFSPFILRAATALSLAAASTFASGLQYVHNTFFLSMPCASFTNGEICVVFLVHFCRMNEMLTIAGYYEIVELPSPP
jgi:hypothetical protein